MIDVENIEFYYKTYDKRDGKISTLKDFFFREYRYKKIFDNISIKIEKGSKVGILGENGSGKTTLIKIMSGLLYIRRGKVSVNGFNPYDKDKDFLRNIGVMFSQKSQLEWDLPAIDTFNYLKAIYKIDDDIFNKTIEEYVELLNLKNKLYTPVRKLSLGERTKFEVLAASLHKPKILFLDEPTIGLDINSQIDLRSYINAYASEDNIVIITSHNVFDIEEICDRVVVLSNKSIVYDDTIANIAKANKFKKVSISKDAAKSLTNDILETYSLNGNNYEKSIENENLSKEISELLTYIDYGDIKVSGFSTDDLLLELRNR